MRNVKGVKIRFLSTLIVNVMQMAFSFFSGLLVARALQPDGYGNLYFLIGSFMAINEILDLGTSSAFYTFISEKKRGRRFYLYYLAWKIIQFGVMSLLIYIIFPQSLLDRIWVGHKRGIIILAFIANFCRSHVWQLASQIGESIRATLVVQVFRVILVIAHLIVIAGAVWLGLLSVKVFFYIIIAEHVVFSLLVLNRVKENIIGGSDDSSFKSVFSEYKVYCIPLIIYGVVGFAYAFVDRWLLQSFGGAVEQGFYGISERLSAISLIVTTAILNIFWKEVAEGKAKGDFERIKIIYKKVSRSLYFFGALISCMLIPHAQELLIKILGPRYVQAWLPLSIMFLFPIHQALGQINGTFFYASSKTKIYSVVIIIMKIISFPITYFLIAPASANIPGLGLGATGMALKMFILQLIGVNILSYIIAKISKWKFDFWYQIVVVAILFAISFGSKWLVKLVINYDIMVLVVSSLLYLVLSAVVFFRFSSLVGISKNDLKGLFQEAKNLFSKK